MTNGAVFQLVTNDGKQDRILMATAFLNKRLKMIYQARQNDPSVSNSTPTLVDIEKTHVLFMNAHFKPFAALGYEYMKIQASGVLGIGGEVSFSIPQYGDFFGDMCVHTKLTAPTFAKASGGNPSPYATGAWCAYPGLRLFQRVRFSVNGNDLDSYTPNAASMYNAIHVQPTQRPAWERCVGQEQRVDAFLAQTGATNDYGANGGTADSYRIWMSASMGAQTYKSSGSVDNLDMFIPLLFWFNLDPRLAVPSVSIPHGQRFVVLTLASQNQMFSLNANGNGNGAPSYVTNIAVTKMEMYVNNIFVNPEIHDIFIKRIGFNLIRVHREQIKEMATENGEFLLNDMKWPIETLYIGVRIKSYQTNTAYNDVWHLYHAFNGAAPSLVMRNVAGLTSGAGATSISNLPTLSARVPMRAIDRVSVKAHGINLYDEYPGAFLDSYMPHMYSKYQASPASMGIMMINFCLYPGAYQPSGYMNVSRAREFYVYMWSALDASDTAVISSGTVGEVVICAVAINFLLITDGSAIIRYAT
jgi:hypothetical protein